MTPPHHPAYPAQDTFAAPARARAELWRVAACLVLFVALGLGLSIAFYNAVARVWPAGMAAIWESEGATPEGMVVLLASFGAWMLGSFAAVLVLHGRGPLSLLGDRARLWPDARRTGLAVAALFLVTGVIFGTGGAEVVYAMPTAVWLAWLPVALLVLLIQVSAEEILFRGYLQQQMAARFASRWVWMVAPSVLFGALHYNPDMGSMALPLVGATTVFGLVAADLTARTGSLGPAIALHFVNNFFALLVLSVQQDMSGLALWVMDIDLSDPAVTLPLLAVELAVMACAWLAARVALRR